MMHLKIAKSHSGQPCPVTMLVMILVCPCNFPLRGSLLVALEKQEVHFLSTLLKIKQCTSVNKCYLWPQLKDWQRWPFLEWLHINRIIITFSCFLLFLKIKIGCGAWHKNQEIVKKNYSYPYHKWLFQIKWAMRGGHHLVGAQILIARPGSFYLRMSICWLF